VGTLFAKQSSLALSDALSAMFSIVGSLLVICPPEICRFLP